jgi:hypothetical protein
MLYENILEDIQRLGKPGTGDLILFQIEDDQWVAALYPILAQKLYADDYDSIERKALDYASDWADRGKFVSVWKEGDANKDEYFRVL